MKSEIEWGKTCLYHNVSDTRGFFDSTEGRIVGKEGGSVELRSPLKELNEAWERSSIRQVNVGLRG